MIKKLGLIGLILIFISGCATAKLTSGPSLALIHHPDALNVGVSKVIDERESANAGTIGATGIRVKQGDLSSTLTNYLTQSVNSNMNVNVTPVAAATDRNAASVAENSNTDRVLAVTIKKIKVFSADAIMQPVEVHLDLEMNVYDRKGKNIYSAPISGSYEKRIGLTIVDKATGELVEATVKDAVNNIVKDEGLKKALEIA